MKRKRKTVRGSRAGLEHTLNEWCIMTGRDSRTLLAAFRKVDFFPKPGERIPFKFIEAALFGEEHTEKVRGMRLDNEERERNARREVGELCEWDDVLQVLNQQFINPMVGALDVAPKELDREWVEKVLKPLLRQKLEAPKAKSK